MLLLLGENFDPAIDRAEIHSGDAQIIGAPSLNAACEEAVKLQQNQTGCIELCGVLGPEGAERINQAVESRVPVGDAVHLPVQDALFRKIFGE